MCATQRGNKSTRNALDIPNGADCGKNRIRLDYRHLFVASDVNDLLLYVPMIASLFNIGIWWHVIQTYPGFLEALGYLYGILVASFCLDALKAYMESDLE
jgi:hypothetical protein